MTANPSKTWHEANQAHLVNALEPIRAALGGRQQSGAARPQSSGRSPRRLSAKPNPSGSRPTAATPALERLCGAFALSPFERSLLLMCAGVELAADFASLVANAHGDPRRTLPTFGLALAVLPDAHWSALIPAAPLRRWRLIELVPGDTLTSSPLRIDERILHYVAGVSHLDERLRGSVDYVTPNPHLSREHARHAQALVEGWRTEQTDLLSLVHLCGPDRAAHRAVAAAACDRLGLRLFAIAASLRRSPAEMELVRQLWARELLLRECGLFVEWPDRPASESRDEAELIPLLEQAQGCFFLSSRFARPEFRRRVRTVNLALPTAREQRTLWQQALGASAVRVNGQVDAIVSQFDLDPGAIDRACAEAVQSAVAGEELGPALWQACRAHARADIEELGARIVPAARWPDLVLPAPQLDILRQIAMHVRQRATVYADWGFAARTSRGLGISALFAGPSGTGKTMAAEVLANELELDLVHIDLSQVVSKYIGETEKNLRRVFDAAERGGAILLFDEADALFGKRSDVKDSHDRYANVEISYLLQRMEAYRGLAILTTNMKTALDQAFMRRIRFVVAFPFPDAEQRAEIWRRAFPPETPTKGLDCGKLAKLAVAGGNIRNIALHAAFLAADGRESVRMTHLRAAAQAECAKLERPLTDAEIGGWQ